METIHRPQKVKSITTEIKTACGPIYVTIGFLHDLMPFELFIRFGKAGGCGSAMADGIARLYSYALRSGMPLKRAIRAFEGQMCHRSTTDNCLNQIAEVLKTYESKTKPIIKERKMANR